MKGATALGIIVQNKTIHNYDAFENDVFEIIDLAQINERARTIHDFKNLDILMW